MSKYGLDIDFMTPIIKSWIKFLLFLEIVINLSAPFNVLKKNVNLMLFSQFIF